MSQFCISNLSRIPLLYSSSIRTARRPVQIKPPKMAVGLVGSPLCKTGRRLRYSRVGIGIFSQVPAIS